MVVQLVLLKCYLFLNETGYLTRENRAKPNACLNSCLLIGHNPAGLDTLTYLNFTVHRKISKVRSISLVLMLTKTIKLYYFVE